RNSDLFVDEEEIKNLHTAVQGELLHRHFGDAVRLEVADNCSERMTEFLLQQFGLQPADLYRVEGPVNLYRLREVPDHVERSELMEILVDAARKGKEVTVVVELMARFDEEANLNWAARLEEVGAHVVYGVVGHKTHAKMALVVRREDHADGKALRRYVHLSTD